MDIELSTPTEIGHKVDVEMVGHDASGVEKNPDSLSQPHQQIDGNSQGAGTGAAENEPEMTTTEEIKPPQPQPQPQDPMPIITTKEEPMDLDLEPAELPEEPEPADPTDSQFNIEVEMKKRLIAEVEKYPNIWKYGHTNYRHWGMAQESWEKISTAVAMPLEECRQSWNRIRSRYAANRSLNAKAKSRLRYFSALGFLEDNFHTSNAEAKADRSKNRKSDFLNYTNLLETQLIEPSSSAGGNTTGTGDNFNYFWDDQTTAPLKEPEEIRKILLHQLRKYDKSHKTCILCNRKSASKYESKLFPYTRKDRKNKTVIRDWKRSTAVSLLQTIGLDLNDSLGYFMDTTYCKACYQLVLDVDYWSRSIKAFQVKLDGARRQIEDILVSNCGAYGDEELQLPASVQVVQVPVPEPFKIVVKEESVTDTELEPETHEPEVEEAEIFSPVTEAPSPRRRKGKQGKRKSDPAPVFTRSGRRVQIKKEYLSAPSASEESEVEESIPIDPMGPDSDDIYNYPLKKRMMMTRSGSAKDDTNFKPKESRTPKDKLDKPTPTNQRFYCKESGCNYSCKYEYLIEVHLNKDHLSDPVPYHCNMPDCDKKFRSSGLLNIHKIREHSGECDGDGAGQSSARDMGLGNGKKSCKFCSKIFSARGLTQHIEQQHSEYQLKPKCSICLKAFNSQGQVDTHEKLHRGKLVDQFSCVLCPTTTNGTGEEHDTIFQDKLDLQRHVQNIHEEGLFKCFPCDITFLTKNRLKHHVYRHHSRESRPELKCPHCEFQAQQPSSLRYHLQKHSVTLDFKCDFPGCTANYKWQAALKRHKLSHTDHKPFECNICGKTFHQESYLRRHQVYHLDLRPFMCEICSSSYKTRKHLNRHMKAHEKDPNGLIKSCKNSKPRRPRLQQITSTIAPADAEEGEEEQTEQLGVIIEEGEMPQHQQHPQQITIRSVNPGTTATPIGATVVEVMQIVDVDAHGTMSMTPAGQFETTYLQFQ